MKVKQLNDIFQEIEANRVIEMNYKGKFSPELYFAELDKNDVVLNKILWRNKDRTQLNTVINTAINTSNSNKMVITTRYNEWKVNIVEK